MHLNCPYHVLLLKFTKSMRTQPLLTPSSFHVRLVFEIIRVGVVRSDELVYLVPDLNVAPPQGLSQFRILLGQVLSLARISLRIVGIVTSFFLFKQVFEKLQSTSYKECVSILYSSLKLLPQA